MERISSFDFISLHADQHGRPVSPRAVDDVVNAAASARYTDVVFIAHGFRNSEEEAENLYARFAAGFDAHRARPELAGALGDRTYLFVGVIWPSKKFSEVADMDGGGVQSLNDPAAGDSTYDRDAAQAELEAFVQDMPEPERMRVRAAFDALMEHEDDAASQDRFVDAVLRSVPFDDADGTEGLEQIRSRSGAEVLASLATPIFLPTVQSDDEGGVSSVSFEPEADSGGVLMVGGFFRSVAGRVGQLLNMGTWYTMKKRCGDVGERVVADTVRRISATAGPARVRVHLVGHSLGGRLMASAAKALAASPVVPVASLTLLEAAFSHYGFSAHAERAGKPGFFRPVLDGNVVRGPLISTFSYQDTVVGKAYSIASRLAGDSVKAVGDKNDKFGGIGRNGAQQTAEVTQHVLQPVGGNYRYVQGTVNDIDGSGGGILNHGDVTNERVTYAFAAAMAGT